MSKSNFCEIVPELNGGVFEEQVNHALTEIARNVVAHRKKGKLSLEFTVQRIGESNQVTVTHGLKSVVPKPRGRVIEETATDTPMHVDKNGKVTLFPNAQTSLELGAGAATGPRPMSADSHH